MTAARSAQKSTDMATIQTVQHDPAYCAKYRDPLTPCNTCRYFPPVGPRPTCPECGQPDVRIMRTGAGARFVVSNCGYVAVAVSTHVCTKDECGRACWLDDGIPTMHAKRHGEWGDIDGEDRCD